MTIREKIKEALSVLFTDQHVTEVEADDWIYPQENILRLKRANPDKGYHHDVTELILCGEDGSSNCIASAGGFEIDGENITLLDVLSAHKEMVLKQREEEDKKACLHPDDDPEALRQKIATLETALEEAKVYGTEMNNLAIKNEDRAQEAEDAKDGAELIAKRLQERLDDVEPQLDSMLHNQGGARIQDFSEEVRKMALFITHADDVDSLITLKSEGLL